MSHDTFDDKSALVQVMAFCTIGKQAILWPNVIWIDFLQDFQIFSL